MLTRFARTSYRRRWAVLGGWVVVLVGLVVLNATVGGKYLDDFDLPGSESQAALDLLASHGFDARTGASGQLVFRADDVTDPAVRAGIDDLIGRIEDVIAPGEVVSPYSPEGASHVNADRTIAYAEIEHRRPRQRPVPEHRQGRSAGSSPQPTCPAPRSKSAASRSSSEPQFSSEALGFMAAIVILLIAFGSVLAMGLPIVTAIFGILAGVSLVGLVVNVIDMPSFSTQAVLMIGIGVGIDYALFIVTRYREGLREGMDPEAAAARALDTAGRAVIFAGMHGDHRRARDVRDRPGHHAGPGGRRLDRRCSRRCSPRSRCCPPCSASSAATSTGSACPTAGARATPRSPSGTGGAA